VKERRKTVRSNGRWARPAGLTAAADKVPTQGGLATELIAVMGPLRRRARLDSAVRCALWALAAWAIAAAVVLSWSKLRPIAHADVLAAGLGTGALVGAAAGWARRRPSLLEVARVADARLEMKERLASAIYFAEAPGDMAARLRADAAAHAAAHNPADAFPLRHHRRLATFALAVALASAVLVVTPNPQAGALARQAADQAALAKVRQAVAQARKDLGTPASARAKAAAAALHEALARLQKARSPLSALVALSALESRLQALDNSSPQDQEEAAAAAGEALVGTPGGARLGQDLTSGNLGAAAGALRSLAAGLSKLTPAQRQALAAALGKAAAAAGSRSAGLARGASATAPPAASAGASASGGFANDLAAASSALAGDQTAAAGRDLGAAANGATASAGAASVQQELDAVQAAIENAKAQVAGQAQADSGAAPAQGNGGRGRGNPEQGGPGAGAASGSQAGAGAGAGAASGPGGGSGGSGTGPGAGSGGSGSGAGGGAGSAGPLRSPAAQVFVGGQPGDGEQVTGTQLGDGKRVETTNYRSVFPAFEKTALQGLGTQVLAPSDQGLVRSYFTSLGGGQ
jgi:hypothetical protein